MVFLWLLGPSRILFAVPTFFLWLLWSAGTAFWHKIVFFSVFSCAMQHVQIVLLCRRQHDFSCFEGVSPGFFSCITFAVILIPFLSHRFASFLISWVFLGALLARLWLREAPSELPHVLLHGGIPGFLVSRELSSFLEPFFHVFCAFRYQF